MFHFQLVITSGYIRLYFIITKFHTELQPQVNVSHDMNSLVFTILYTQPWTLKEEGQKRSLVPSWVLNFDILL